MRCHSHRPGSLKQVNKPFKGKKGSSTKKKSNTALNNACLTSKGQQSKQERLLAAKQHTEKRLEASRLKRRFGSKTADCIPPKVVMILPFSPGLDPLAFKTALIKAAGADSAGTACRGKPVTFQLPSWAQTSAVGEGKRQRITLIDANPYAATLHTSTSGMKDVDEEEKLEEFMSTEALHLVLDMAKAANVVMCLLPGTHCTVESPPFDALGYKLISVLKLQGMPTPVGVLAGDEAFNALSSPKRKEKQKLVGRFFTSEFGDDKKFLSVDQTESAVKQVIRTLSNVAPKEFPWRGETRGYILPDRVQLYRRCGGTERAKLLIEGFARGVGFTVKHPVHITGVGDAILERISEVPWSPSAEKDEKMKDPAAQVLQELTPELEAGLKEEWEGLRPFDPLAGDQTWPTPQELDDAERERRRRDKLNHITSPDEEVYQNAWLDFSDKNGENVNDVDVSDGGCGAASLSDEEADDFGEESNTFQELTTAELGKHDEDVKRNKPQPFELEDRCREDLEFPDEVDIAPDQVARDRLARYRCLKSFRSSPWDPYEELPHEYSRIFHFDAFNSTARYAKQISANACAEAGGGVSITGRYVRLELRLSEEDPSEKAKVEYLEQYLRDLENQNRGLSCETQKAPLLVSTLLPYERKVSVCHVALHRRDECTMALPSKTLVQVQCGLRRFLVKPLFSQAGIQPSSSGKGIKAKFERFFHPGSSAIATFYAPTTFPPAPSLLFCFPTKEGGTDEDRVVMDNASVLTTPSPRCAIGAWGSVVPPDPLRVIVKRIVLTGYPFRVHKRKAVVRYMFFNPQDIRWFMPVELCTKKGLRGHITEPLGTHGYMKCVFNDRLEQSDTVCMFLYKRVFPKWFPLSWGDVTDAPPTA